MAVKRIVDTSFWTDEKVMDLFSPEDRYFMLYLMTNPHTTQLGIYQINIKYMALELGYSQDTIKVLIERFENKYNIIKYSYDTKEIAIKNYLKHSIIKGGKPVEDLLKKEISKVKDKTLLQFIYNNISTCDTLNQSVANILELLNENKNDNVNDNDNDNDNDVSYHDTYNDTYNDTHKKNNQVEILSVEECEFNDLWKIYKRKVNKTNSLKTYIKVKKGYKQGSIKYPPTPYEVIKDGVERYNKYLENSKTEEQYIKHFSTWLNARGWEDDYVIKKQKDSYFKEDLAF